MEILNIIKKYKSMIVAALVLIAVIAAIIIVKQTVTFDETKAEYGNRLDGMDKVKVTNDQKKQLKENLKDSTKSVEVTLSGRTINLIIEVNPDTAVGDARAIAERTLEVFTDEQKSYYDIQALVKNEENKDQYPIIGYKHKTRGSYTWTRDR